MVLDSIIPEPAPSDPGSRAETDSVLALLADGMVSAALASRRSPFLESSFQGRGEWGFS